MSAFRLLAPAKVNLYLRIVGRRNDGLHDIETVFQKIDIGDELALESAARDELVVAESPWPLGPDEKNLAWRALIAMRQLCEFPSVRVSLTKRIPPGAGLGGGSSDAAAMLRGLVTMFNLRVDDTALQAAARALGADVPFLLSPNACAIGRGIGDELTPIRHEAAWRIALIYPGHPSATAEAYRDWRSVAPPPAPPVEAMVRALESRDLTAAARAVHNDFAAFLFQRFPAMARAAEMLRESGCVAVWPTGSGSTVVGLMAAGAGDLNPTPSERETDVWINVASLLQHGRPCDSPQDVSHLQHPRDEGHSRERHQHHRRHRPDSSASR